MVRLLISGNGTVLPDVLVEISGFGPAETQTQGLLNNYNSFIRAYIYKEVI